MPLQNYCANKTILIVGFGKIGQAFLALSKSNYPFSRYLIIDLEENNIDGAQFYRRNIASDSITDLLDGVDVVASCLPWKAHEQLLHACFERAIPIFGVARPNYDHISDLEKAAEFLHITMLNGCGLEPGLSEIFCNYLASSYQSIESIKVYCGGVPKKPKSPLGYQLMFDAKNLPFSKRDTYCIHEKKLQKVERFSGVETLELDDIGTLEAFHDGLLPWRSEFAKSYHVKEYLQKTLRWPGYSAVVNFLHDSGLYSDVELIDENSSLTYRDLIENKLIPQLAASSSEVEMTLLHIKMQGLLFNSGECAETKFLLKCEVENSKSIPSMAKITALPLIFAINKWARSQDYIPIFKPEKYFSIQDIDNFIIMLEKNSISLHCTRSISA